MANKIIIDRIDVSGCEFLNYDEQLKCETCNLSDFNNRYRCNKNPDCYYKQLKRKESKAKSVKEFLDDKGKKIKVTKQFKVYEVIAERIGIPIAMANFDCEDKDEQN